MCENMVFFWENWGIHEKVGKCILGKSRKKGEKNAKAGVGVWGLGVRSSIGQINIYVKWSSVHVAPYMVVNRLWGKY